MQEECGHTPTQHDAYRAHLYSTRWSEFRDWVTGVMWGRQARMSTLWSLVAETMEDGRTATDPGGWLRVPESVINVQTACAGMEILAGAVDTFRTNPAALLVVLAASGQPTLAAALALRLRSDYFSISMSRAFVTLAKTLDDDDRGTLILMLAVVFRTARISVADVRGLRG